jgi:class 3 adenylate cyclase
MQKGLEMKYNLKQNFKELNKKIIDITSNQNIENCSTVEEALKKVKSEVNTWIQIDDVIVVFSDLKNSTGISFDKQGRTMTKLLEYLNQPFVKIHKEFGSEFVEIKGDGGIAIYSKENAINALLASISIKTFYFKYINKKVKETYDVDFEVTTGISKGNLRLKQIGMRGLNFPVWAGETINLSALISKELKHKSQPNNYVGITSDIYDEIKFKKLNEYLYLSCGCGNNKTKINLWTSETIPGKGGKRYYYMNNNWCDIHGQEYLDKILEVIE